VISGVVVGVAGVVVPGDDAGGVVVPGVVVSSGVGPGAVVAGVVVSGVVVPEVVVEGGAASVGVVPVGCGASVGSGVALAGEVSADAVAGGVVGVGSSVVCAGASLVGGIVAAVGTGSSAWKVGSALGSNQSSVPGGTTPMVGISSGPAALRHSVGMAGCALATVVAPSCAAIGWGVWPRATRAATARTPQLVWSRRRVTTLRRGTGRPPNGAPRIMATSRNRVGLPGARSRGSVIRDVHPARYGRPLSRRAGRRPSPSPCTAGSVVLRLPL
jgi:hypothetical protein